MQARRRFLILATLAVAAGVLIAIHRAWVCDDAFISFRYADNLVHGNGLVFNVGERVEGYTNFLWTLWIALGIKLGLTPEAWSIAWGVVFYTGTLVLLAHASWHIGRAAGLRWHVPASVLIAVVHLHWVDFATSGLETSAFTFFALAGYLLVCPRDGNTSPTPRSRFHIAGATYAIATLIRPDGVILAAVCSLWLLTDTKRDRALSFALGFLLVWLPPTAWRFRYYGNFFPNTYYAKSASLAWWSQGFFYARLYFTRYWPLLLAFPLGALAKQRRTTALELGLALAYTLYVMRVGGDFMFARMLIPISPYLVLSLERGLAAVLAERHALHMSVVVSFSVAMLLMPAVVDQHSPGRRGIVDERLYYVGNDWAERMDRQGEILGRFFAGLPVRVGFVGTEARWIYRSRVRRAIECETGLTDAWLAHRSIRRRGRVGHEKRAPITYLVASHTHFVIEPFAPKRLRLDGALDDVRVEFGDVQARLVTWDPEVMHALQQRGARIPDLPTYIDGVIARLPSMSDHEVNVEFANLKRMYFFQVNDRAREAPFLSRLAEER